MNDYYEDYGDGFNNDDGDSVGGGYIEGHHDIYKKGDWLIDKINPPSPGLRLLVLRTVATWLSWEKDAAGNPTPKHIPIVNGCPKREELGQLDQSKWPLGLDGKPTDPFRRCDYVYMIDLETAESHTFSTTSIGGRRAVRDLKSAINNMRHLYPRALPIIAYDTWMMPSKKFGPTPAPKFRIIGWQGKDAPPSPALPSPDAPPSLPPGTTKRGVQKIADDLARGGNAVDDAAHAARRSDLDDEIPF